MPCATQHFNIVVFVAPTPISINTVILFIYFFFCLFVAENHINGGDYLHEIEVQVTVLFLTSRYTRV